jgi:hypothetical protein
MATLEAQALGPEKPLTTPRIVSPTTPRTFLSMAVTDPLGLAKGNAKRQDVPRVPRYGCFGLDPTELCRRPGCLRVSFALRCRDR